MSVIIVSALRWTTGATSLFVNASPTAKISKEGFMAKKRVRASLKHEDFDQVPQLEASKGKKGKALLE